MSAIRRPARRQGFTVVEVMIAMVILAIGLAGVTASMLTATRLDRRFTGRAAAHAVAMDLVREIERWRFTDPRLAYVNNHAGAAFSEPEVVSFSIAPGTPPQVTEVLSPVPDHSEAECGSCGRDLARTHAQEPGSTYLFRRYWNVTVDPANPNLKVVAVHVTWNRSSTDRGVVTAFTSVFDNEALSRAVLQEGF